MNRLAFRFLLPVLLTAASSASYALGLGELRGQPSLGERLRLEIDILGEGKAGLDVTCFRLVQPSKGGDLPWLKKASLSIRKGKVPVLEIRTESALREPVTQVAVQIGCGHEISREYIVLASPSKDVAEAQPAVIAAVERNTRSTQKTSVAPRVRPPKSPEALPPSRTDAPPRPMPGRLPDVPREGMSDRLMLSAGGDVGDPSLRLATGLPDGQQAANVTDAQREVLRLEYRMLAAMNEQATTQLETAEKLRRMEETLGGLQQRATEFSQRAEKSGLPANPPASPASAPQQPAPEESSFGLSIYGILAGAAVGLLAWVGWRRYRAGSEADDGLDDEIGASPEVVVDPRRAGEREEPGIVDLPVEPPVPGAKAAVDLELDGAVAPAQNVPSTHSESLDSVLSVSATTLDEHFEANPVMELADIMLSFGRVKGAAQALQEYIDHNPQEALQPWIRLMDVYRMAGMRDEFEAVARNLNQNFNVEVQSWDEATAKPAQVDLVLGEDAEQPVAPVAPRPEGVEDMPRIMATLCELWTAGDVLGYMYQLLRDNRGGQRVGFALPVVEDILFLIDIKEAVLRAEKEAAAA